MPRTATIKLQFRVKSEPNFLRMAEKVHGKTKRTMEMATQYMEFKARTGAPVKTGKLKRNIRGDTSDGIMHIVSKVGVTALNMPGTYNYARAQERGVADGPRGYVVIGPGGVMSPWTAFHSTRGPSYRKRGRWVPVTHGFLGKFFMKKALVETADKLKTFWIMAG